MILLDTNVVSELMKSHVHPNVAAFIADAALEEVFLPSVVVAEIRYGIKRLPEGRRRDGIARDFETLLQAGFTSRILPFDAACADGYAAARAAREKGGRPIQGEDALIGGAALVLGATLATRNVSDFDGYGLSLINPWEYGAMPPSSSAAAPRRRSRPR